MTSLPPTRPHLLKVPSPPNSTTDWQQSLQHGFWGDIQIQPIAAGNLTTMAYKISVIFFGISGSKKQIRIFIILVFVIYKEKTVSLNTKPFLT
jgi:hypothetical protein